MRKYLLLLIFILVLLVKTVGMTGKGLNSMLDNPNPVEYAVHREKNFTYVEGTLAD